MRVCRDCNTQKDAASFEAARNSCRVCRAAYKKKHQQDNKETIKTKKAAYREANKDKIAISRKAYRETHASKINEYSARYWVNNKSVLLEKRSKYRKENTQKVKAQDAQYRKKNPWKYTENCKLRQRKRRADNPMFRARQNLSCLLRNSLKRGGYSKTAKSAKLLGAPFDVVYPHLVESAIRNYGYYDQDFTYHIDHIIPCASAKSEEELVKLQHYTNLQYLYPKDNIVKADRLNFNLKEIQ